MDWLKAYKADFYDTFWVFQGMIEYKKSMEFLFEEELINRNIENKIVADIVKEQFKKQVFILEILNLTLRLSSVY